MYEHYSAAMLRRAKRYVSNVCDAEDVVSNCWLRLIPRTQMLMEMDAQARSSYIMATVQNEAIDYYRRQRHRFTTTIALGDGVVGIDAGEEYDNLIVGDTLASMLAMLPPHEARVIRFKLNGIDNAEISKSLHISQSTVRVYWLRGKMHLRSLIQDLEQ